MVANILTLGILLLNTPPALNQTPCVDAAPLAQGVLAPCSGVLWPTAWSSQAVECVNVTHPKCLADLQYAQGLTTACQEHKEALNSLCTKKLDDLSDLLNDAARLESPAWYESPTFWGVGGFILGGVSVYFIIESTK